MLIILSSFNVVEGLDSRNYYYVFHIPPNLWSMFFISGLHIVNYKFSFSIFSVSYDNFLLSSEFFVFLFKFSSTSLPVSYLFNLKFVNEFGRLISDSLFVCDKVLILEKFLAVWGLVLIADVLLQVLLLYHFLFFSTCSSTHPFTSLTFSGCT